MPPTPDTLDFIAGTFESAALGIFAVDGLNSNGIYYRVSRLSDKKVIRDSVWDLSNETLFVGNSDGTIAELRALGISWKEIWPAALELVGSVHYTKRAADRTYE